MARSEIRITVDRSLPEVFDTYTQFDTWGRSCVGSVRWTQGTPWEVGSRLQIEPEHSYGIVVDQVLTDFEPYRLVAFISHFAGVTLQTEAHFRALTDHQTEIVVEVEFVGTLSRIVQLPLRPAIERGTQQVFDALKRECERIDDSRTTAGESEIKAS